MLVTLISSSPLLPPPLKPKQNKDPHTTKHKQKKEKTNRTKKTKNQTSKQTKKQIQIQTKLNQNQKTLR